MTKLYGTPGPRSLGPDCCTSEKLAACSVGAQLLFDRLIVQSDDQGRQHGDPSVVKGSCVPLVREATLAKVGRWLRELHDNKLVRWFAVRELQVVQVEQWWRFQEGMRRAYASRWPAPDGWDDRVYRSKRTDDNDDDPPADRPQPAGTSPAECGHVAPESGLLPLPLPLPAKQPSGKKPPEPSLVAKKPSGIVAETLAWFSAEYERLLGTPYVVKAADNAQLPRALKTFPDLRVRLLNGLKTGDVFIANSDRSLAFLIGQINRPSLRGIDVPALGREQPNAGTGRGGHVAAPHAPPSQPDTTSPKVDPALARKAIRDALAAAQGKPVT